MRQARLAFEQDRDNVVAWSLFHTVVTRMTKDTGTAAMILDRLTRDADPETFAALVERFTVLYEVFCPPPAEEHE